MFIFIDIWLLVLFAVFFVLSFLIVERIRISKLVFSWAIFDSAKYIFEGILYGLLLLIFYLIIEAINNNFSVPVYIIVTVTLIIFRNLIIGLVAGLPILIYYHIQNNFNILMIWTLILAYALYIALVIVKFYKDEFIYRFGTVTLFAVISLIILLPIEQSTQGYLTTNSVEIFFFPFAGSLIFMFIMEFVIKFLDQANILNDSISFNFSRYYRQSLKNTAIGSFVMEHKITKALYGIFEFDFAPQDTNEKNIEIRESILLDFEKEMPEKATLFRTDLNRYGFFIPFDRDTDLKKMLDGNKKQNRDFDDPLKSIETIIKGRNMTYMTSYNVEVPITMRAGIVLYGIQEQSVESMLHLCEQSLEQSLDKTNDNIVQFYDPKIHLQKMEDYIQISEMDAKFNLDSFTINFSPIYFPNKKKQSLTFIEIDKTSGQSQLESVRDLIDFLGWTEYFDRYSAWFAISKYKGDYPIALFYSPKILISEKFDSTEFVNKLKKLNFNPRNLTLIFDNFSSLNESNLDKFNSSIKGLADNGVSFALHCIQPPKGIKIPNLKYNFINDKAMNSSPKTWDESDEITQIFYQVDSVSDLKNLDRNKNIAICGGLVGKSEINQYLDQNIVKSIDSEWNK